MEGTAVTIRYDMLASASRTMKAVNTRLRDKEVQELIREIDEIRRNYQDEVAELRSDYAAQLHLKMLRLNELLNRS